MFPRKLDRRQLERLMRQMGMKTTELEGVEEVRIRLKGEEIILPAPSVLLTEVGGQRTYQISGEGERRERIVPEEDVRLVMEQTGASEQEAREELKRTGGDLAEAILRLKK
ncbi:MAG: nascent polypeptide-associated complex protein [Candidatus Hadarchaeales archaeon]